MRRIAASLLLVLPALAFAGPVGRVVPAVRPLACGSCLLTGGVAPPSLVLDARGVAVSAPSVALAAPAITLTAPGVAPRPEALKASALVAAGPAAAPQGLVRPASSNLEEAVAAARQAAAAGDAASAAAALPAEAELMALFDGSRPQGADGSFTPVAAGRGLVGDAAMSDRLQRRLKALKGDVAEAVPAMRRSVSLSGWNGPNTVLDGPCCGDAAPKLAALLRMRGYPAVLVESEFHYYVVVRFPEADVVVDPTFRQFFGRENAPAAVPAVFVGTWASLDGAFSRFHAHKTTRYGAQRIYRDQAAAREETLRGAALALADAGAGAEHAVLRPLLAPATPPARDPKLVVP
jgi:hypothetical protein